MTRRGNHNLFSNLLENDEPEVVTANRISGRDKALLQKRDTKLVYRHYYYLKIQKLQYPDILSTLSEEFDLAEYTIVERLQKEDNYKLLRTTIREQKSIAALRKEYPYLNWNTAA